MSAPPTPRRRGPGPVQQQRSAETRAAVIRATVELIGAGGVEAATSAAISRASRVSWGGIQHQFGSKEAVLDATLAWLIADLTTQWRAPEPVDTDLESRVEALVSVVWHVVRHPSYAPLMALFRHRTHAGRDDELIRLQEAARQTTSDLLADVDLDTATLDAVHAFCFAAVGGVADQQPLAPNDPQLPERLLAMVRAGIVATLRP